MDLVHDARGALKEKKVSRNVGAHSADGVPLKSPGLHSYFMYDVQIEVLRI